jgi:hypothetical protein
MAKKPVAKKKTTVAKKTVARKTEVRNSPIPKKVSAPKGKIGGAATGQSSAATGKKDVTYDMIARRAYEISQSPAAGGELDNWLRAERELRGV